MNLVTKWMTLVTKGKTLVTKGRILVTLCDQGKTLANMPQIEKQKHIGWAKPKQLPAGPREKRPIGRLFSSINIMYNVQ